MVRSIHLSAPRKGVAQQIEERRISCFLPLYRSVRRWKDRRKELELALFPGYVFVRIALKDRLRVLQLAGVVRFVSFNGYPVPLPDERDGISNERAARRSSLGTTSLFDCRAHACG